MRVKGVSDQYSTRQQIHRKKNTVVFHILKRKRKKKKKNFPGEFQMNILSREIHRPNWSGVEHWMQRFIDQFSFAGLLHIYQHLGNRSMNRCVQCLQPTKQIHKNNKQTEDDDENKAIYIHTMRQILEERRIHSLIPPDLVFSMRNINISTKIQ